MQDISGAISRLSTPAGSSVPTRNKIAIYVFNPGLDRYLTFVQPGYPEAGRQVPAGTIEAGETPLQAASRELGEETGRAAGLPLFHFADTIYDMREYKPEIHHRSWFFGIAAADEFPSGPWNHVERRGGRIEQVAEFSWTDTSAEEELIAGHGHLLPLALHLARSWDTGQLPG
ncbi:NUDIX domain-containing protein [Arthrobacter sp. D1-29]